MQKCMAWAGGWGGNPPLPTKETNNPSTCPKGHRRPIRCVNVQLGWVGGAKTALSPQKNATTHRHMFLYGGLLCTLVDDTPFGIRRGLLRATTHRVIFFEGPRRRVCSGLGFVAHIFCPRSVLPVHVWEAVHAGSLRHQYPIRTCAEHDLPFCVLLLCCTL